MCPERGGCSPSLHEAQGQQPIPTDRAPGGGATRAHHALKSPTCDGDRALSKEAALRATSSAPGLRGSADPCRLGVGNSGRKTMSRAGLRRRARLGGTEGMDDLGAWVER